jgi:PEP-CTERM motif
MSNRIAATVLFAGVIVASAAANAQPSDVSFGGSSEDGGLGGEFVFLNSGGASPFLTPGSWSNWFVPDAVFSATLGGTTYSNTDDDGSIVYYGYPDTTTYGETFFAPGDLTDFQFLINGNPGPGTDSKLVIATWDSSTFRAVTPLFVEDVTIPLGGPNWIDSGSIDVALNSGQEYVAFLTVSDAAAGTVPEPSTWAMMMLGFAGLGYAAFRRNSKGQTAVSAI